MVKKKVIVLGGGIVGLSTAYYLIKEGHEVTIIDKGRLDSGASHVNAGYLTPSHIVPMAAPGMISKGMKWMFNAKSPFYIKPRFDLDLIKWGLKFIKSCTNDHVQSSMKSILDINLLSKKLYLEMQKSELFDFHLETKGLLMAYKTSHAEKEESEISKWAKDLGIKVEQFSKEQVLKTLENIGSFGLTGDSKFNKVSDNFQNILDIDTLSTQSNGQISMTNAEVQIIDNVEQEDIDLLRTKTRNDIIIDQISETKSKLATVNSYTAEDAPSFESSVTLDFTNCLLSANLEDASSVDTKEFNIELEIEPEIISS